MLAEYKNQSRPAGEAPVKRSVLIEKDGQQYIMSMHFCIADPAPMIDLNLCFYQISFRKLLEDGQLGTDRWDHYFGQVQEAWGFHDRFADVAIEDERVKRLDRYSTVDKQWLPVLPQTHTTVGYTLKEIREFINTANTAGVF
jgi:hypothetical protein